MEKFMAVQDLRNVSLPFRWLAEEAEIPAAAKPPMRSRADRVQIR
jgi:hypothetical protein